MKTALLLSAFAMSCYLIRTRSRHKRLCRKIGAFYAEALPG